MADAIRTRKVARVAGAVLTVLLAVAGCGASSPADESAEAVARATVFGPNRSPPTPSTASVFEETPTPTQGPSSASAVGETADTAETAETHSPSPTPLTRASTSPGLDDRAALESDAGSDWYLMILPIDEELRSVMEPTSWREGCPVGLDELRLLKFPHVTFGGEVLEGELIVAAGWAEAVGGVFAELFAAGYEVERIELVDRFDGDDQRSMVANNTSAFNCREVAYRPGVWSNHAWGTAIDVNPLYNPYVSGDFVDPAAAAAFVDRSVERTGMVADGDAAVVAFERIGWTWGGRWDGGVKDYQHFSANGR